ncbi:MAG: hypothetical protein AAF497_02745 [Planctomycetota bacterium]
MMVGVWVMPAVATALSCAPPTYDLAAAYESADSIIVGLVTECEEEVSTEAWVSGGSNCSFVSLETLKDATPKRDYSGVASSAACGLSLKVGEQYLLFLNHENKPIVNSASLWSKSYPNPFAGEYLEILRDYRDGRAIRLAEPWTFTETKASCRLVQNAGRNSIVIGRGTSIPPKMPKPVWTKHESNGQVVYKTTYPALNQQTGRSMGDIEMVAYGKNPDGSYDSLGLTVTFAERSSSNSPMRRATISVGAQTWPLYRTEITASFGATASPAMVHYYLAGEDAEKILSAMAEPADIVAEAILVEQNDDPGGSPQLQEDTPYFGPAPPSDSVVVQSTSRAKPVQEDAEPILRLKSRSDRLAMVIDDFRACYSNPN